MARIPVSERRVSIPGAQGVRVPQGAFDSGLGGLAEGADRAGSILLRQHEKMQEEDDARAAMNAYAAASDKVRALTLDPDKGIYAKRGADALGVYATGEKELGSIYEATRGGLKSDRQREAFDVLWTRRRETELNSIARHEAQERRTYRDQTAEALVKSAVIDAAGNYTNPDAVALSLRQAEVVLRANSAGKPAELVELEVQAARSTIHAGVVERMMVDSAIGAQRYLQAHRDEIDGVTLAKLGKVLEGGVKKETAQSYAKAIGTGAPIAVAGAVASQAQAQGVDPALALTVLQLENPNADPAARPVRGGVRLSSAHGLFQMTDGTWKARGGSDVDRGDPQKQMELGIRNLKEEAAGLQGALGRPPEGWEVYLAHQQGGGGARKILTGDAGANAVEALGRDEVLNNGGTADMTVGQFRDVWRAKYERAAARVKVPSSDIQERALDANLSLADKLDAASAIEDDDTRRMTVAIITEEHGRIQAAANARRAAIREQAWQALETEPSLAAIPPAVWGSLDLRDQQIIENYVKKRARGDEIETDLSTYDRLNVMAGARPGEFAKVDLNEYRDKLSEVDWRRMSDLRRGILAAGQGATADTTALRGANQMADDALRAIGIDPTPKEGSADAKRAALFRRRVQEELSELETRQGRKAKPDEMQMIVDRLTIQGTVKGTGWMGMFATEKFRFEGEEGEELVVDDLEDVPPAMVERARKAFTARGKVPTDDDLAAMIGAFARGDRAGMLAAVDAAKGGAVPAPDSAPPRTSAPVAPSVAPPADVSSMPLGVP
jgi:hypothetical protein